ncbi:hypothetical protein COCSADRAFT_331779 [Bipolaris sorokiniana ND90Pr]|uniref:Uncharacterized protein n=1 Tax=Cochliobolus sativus (strain ND90Pr / ATCC 201652) TaxID=665912 RepID=M2RA90_COCSN|nr:uncharacterized protein COCSADRAFT_331779 [Bipolaris sorokiniana ND90Pr]EMD63799.1 hypothetical protein COCSADRAFT_331779 [Bipolaris sorokiniana ND90Pr]
MNAAGVKKANLFRDTSPTPPEADLRDVLDALYNDQAHTPPTTEKEIRDDIRAASPSKARGLDDNIDRVLQAETAQLTTHPTRIHNRSLRLGYCLAHFRESLSTPLPRKYTKNRIAELAWWPISWCSTFLVPSMTSRMFACSITCIKGEWMRR